MAISTPANLTSSTDDVDRTVYTTASVTLTSGRLYLLFVQAGRTGALPGDPTIAGNGSWTKVTGVNDWGSAGTRSSTLWRCLPGSNSTAAVTMTFANTLNSCSWHIMEIASGFDNGGTNGSAAIVQSSTAIGAAASTSNTVTLAAFGNASNLGVGFFCTDVAGAHTPANSYTELVETAGTSPARVHSSNYRFADADPGITYASARSGGIGVEIGISPPDLAVNVTQAVSLTDTPGLMVQAVDRNLAVSDSVGHTESVAGFIYNYFSQPAGAAGLDTWLYSAAPTNNDGSGTTMHAGESGGVTRSLLKFDLSSIPANATIVTATLTLAFTVDLATNTRTLRVYRQKRAWVEGQATWNIYSTGNNWGTAGGFDATDAEQTDIGSVSVLNNLAVPSLLDILLTATNKAELDLGNGWLLKMDTETLDRWQMATSDNATVAQRPKLAIDWFIPADLSINQSESVSLTEPVAFQVDSFAVKSESILVSESVSLVVESSGETAVAVSDSVSLTENVALVVESFIIPSDSILLTEVVASQVDSFVAVSEGVSLTENVSLVLVSPVAVSDSSLLVESVLLDIALPASATDNVGLAENVTLAVESFIVQAEGISLTESVSLSVVSEVAASDSISLNETVLLTGVSLVSLTQAVGVAESILVATDALAVNIAEGISLTETISFAQVLEVSGTESVLLTEAATLTVSDPTLSVAESVVVSENAILDLTILVNQAENVSLAESALVAVGLTLSIAETVALAENLLVATGNLEIAGTESITLTESASVEAGEPAPPFVFEISIAKMVMVTAGA